MYCEYKIAAVVRVVIDPLIKPSNPFLFEKVSILTISLNFCVFAIHEVVIVSYTNRPLINGSLTRLVKYAGILINPFVFQGVDAMYHDPSRAP